MVEKALLAKRERETNEILAKLKVHAEDMRVNEPVTERMMFTAALLLKAPKQAAFEKALNALDKEWSERLMFKCVGPVPPYNFVEITLS